MIHLLLHVCANATLGPIAILGSIDGCSYSKVAVSGPQFENLSKVHEVHSSELKSSRAVTVVFFVDNY